ncbi:hypothetical protein [Actinoplanes teichomyceticus]|nr:hypothetical protein [Actinoplanes teichomyceticus]GIF16206.1 hypothetical protein Ate01nite_62380 [Actinoplanes teichomyceticus]
MVSGRGQEENPVPDAVGPDARPRGGVEEHDWEARLQAAVAETLRKREEQRATRQEFAERRRHGLAARHQQKLARSSPRGSRGTQRGRGAAGGDMPQPTRTITLDVSALSAVDLKNLAHVAGRAAGSTAIGTSAVAALGQLARDAARLAREVTA